MRKKGMLRNRDVEEGAVEEDRCRRRVHKERGTLRKEASRKGTGERDVAKGIRMKETSSNGAG